MLKKTLLLGLVLALGASVPGWAQPTPCDDDETMLCLRDGRYAAQVRWHDPATGTSGEGRAVPLTDGSGGFWFFEPGGIELVVKLIDGEAINGHEWVFYGGLSDVEFRLLVTDTATGLTVTYHNPPFKRPCGGDMEAFDAISLEDAEPIPCPKLAPEPTLLLGRFAVEIAWKDFEGRRGAGQTVARSDDTLYAWFFTPDNVELLLRIHDGRLENGHFWAFLGALSNVEYRITITDTFTDRVHSYVNLLGNFASGADLRAFPG